MLHTGTFKQNSVCILYGSVTLLFNHILTQLKIVKILCFLQFFITQIKKYISTSVIQIQISNAILILLKSLPGTG